MNYHPMQFFFIGSPEFQSIGLNRIQTNEYITGKYLTLPVIEGNYVRVIIMIQIFPVHIQNIFVITKNKRDT